jgi:hypothetical protein
MKLMPRLFLLKKNKYKKFGYIKQSFILLKLHLNLFFSKTTGLVINFYPSKCLSNQFLTQFLKILRKY